MKTLTVPKMLLVLTVGFWLGAASSAKATLLLQENFDYPLGTQVSTNQFILQGGDLGSPNGGTGWNAGQYWYDGSYGSTANLYTVTNGLSFGSLTVSSNALWQAGDNIGANRTWSGMVAGNTYYISLLVRYNGNHTTFTSDYAGIQVGSVYWGLCTEAGSSTNREFEIGQSFGGGTDGATRIRTGIFADFANYPVYFLVAKIQYSGTGTAGLDTNSLWINPMTSVESNAGPAQAVNTAVATTPAAAPNVRFYGISSAYKMQFTALRIGTNWADVTPGLPAVPSIPVCTQSGTNFILSWPPSYGLVLQAQTNSLATGLNPSNAWVTVPAQVDANGFSTNGISNYEAVIPIDNTQPSVFYHLSHP